MNEKLARQLLDAEIESLRAQSYEQLRDALLDRAVVKEVVGPDGVCYELELQAFWDDKPGKDLRVVVSISDGKGWRSFSPLTDGLLVPPSGEPMAGGS